jgi:hypothetical protein
MQRLISGCPRVRTRTRPLRLGVLFGGVVPRISDEAVRLPVVGAGDRPLPYQKSDEDRDRLEYYRRASEAAPRR